ncbi:MAG: hypothetical protein A3H47_02815 [Deltaproteobacteria bacterium RIFCSPLOWO2_02_FULL_42_39]|nr:MAG: hypothetical protein A3H47_02815 [Deltaproteobacteria bacterium RIFCSPLOWO2_02_FULL_42_39]
MQGPGREALLEDFLFWGFFLGEFYARAIWNEIPEKAGARSFSVDVLTSFADLNKASTVLLMFTARFPGMLLVPHLGQIKAETFSTSA